MNTAGIVDRQVTVDKQPIANGGRPRHADRRARGPGGGALVKEASRQARRVAAMVLEVLAGARTPTEAAQALELSVPRYYQLETRALHGLLAACEPGRKGRVPSLAQELTLVQRDKERLQREVLRQQALVRAAQRTVGLPPPALPKSAGKKKTRRRRLARALHLADRLHNANQDDTPAAAPSPGVASPGVAKASV
jgi:hypothetical protein